MYRRDPIILRSAAAVLAGVLAVACNGQKQLEYARHSLYDTDFAAVYTAVVDATRAIYPNLDDNPGPGRISTAWHQVQMASGNDLEMTNTNVLNQQQGVGGGIQNQSGSTAASMGGMPTRLATKRYYIRFDVTVVGGRPWRVKVVGHASEWDPGAAMPVEMHGIAKPPWLGGRTDALQVAIYKKMAKFAVPMKEEHTSAAVEELPKTDPATFKAVPAGAAKRLAAIKDVLVARDYQALRDQVADDIVWSLGGGAGGDEAIVMWQADPAAFDAMNAALTAGCAADGDHRVACPGGAPVANTYQLVLEPRGDTWKVTSFVKAE